MTVALYAVLAVAVLGGLYWLWVAARAYWTFRGTRVITCPETRAPAAVEVDAAHSAATALVRPDLRLKSCSLWPERRHCGQPCLDQIESAPEACLLRTILASWYQGRSCVFCGKPFGEIHLTDHKPSMLSPEERTVEWCEVRAERVYEVLSTHRPVCWDCHIAETFRRLYPERVVDRPRSAGSAQAGTTTPLRREAAADAQSQRPDAP